MDLNSLASLDRRPFLSKFLHHFFPYEERLVGEFINTLLGLLLELEESETSLNGRSLLHEEL